METDMIGAQTSRMAMRALSLTELDGTVPLLSVRHGLIVDTRRGPFNPLGFFDSPFQESPILSLEYNSFHVSIFVFPHDLKVEFGKFKGNLVDFDKHLDKLRSRGKIFEITPILTFMAHFIDMWDEHIRVPLQ